jgi:hypothetical protein
MTSSRFLWNNTKIIIKLGTADDELWPMIQRKLDVLNKAGLSKDNFMASESHTVTTSSANSNGEAKITDFFSTSLTEEDIAALDDDYDPTEEDIAALDDDYDPMIQRKLDVLNKAGLSKDNFMASESHTVTTSSANSNGEAKITDFFSTSLTEEDIAALDDDYDVEEYSSKSIAQEAKRPRL